MSHNVTNIDPKLLWEKLNARPNMQAEEDKFHRIREIYRLVEEEGCTSGVDFDSITEQDILDAIDDLSSYSSNYKADNSGIVLFEAYAFLVEVQEELRDLPPQKLHLEFF